MNYNYISDVQYVPKLYLHKMHTHIIESLIPPEKEK
jgi:hypothetical protein